MDEKMREQFWRGQRSIRGAAWRNHVAQEITNLSHRIAAETWDPLTIDAAKYYALRFNGSDGRERAAAAYPKIESALTLNDHGAKTDVIKLMILADFPASAIAERIGIEAAVVDVWERLFFNMRDIRGAAS